MKHYKIDTRKTKNNLMTNYSNLQKYLNYEFSTGCTTGEDYKEFQRKYLAYLRDLCRENSWELARAIKGHYEFSTFIRKGEKYVYMSICDVRFFQDDWYNSILVRTAISDIDYTGGTNNYTDLPQLRDKVAQLLEKR